MVEDNEVTMSLNLHINADRKLVMVEPHGIWYLADIGNNAQEKVIFGVCWFLQIFMRRLIIMMLV